MLGLAENSHNEDLVVNYKYENDELWEPCSKSGVNKQTFCSVQTRQLANTAEIRHFVEAKKQRI